MTGRSAAARLAYYAAYSERAVDSEARAAVRVHFFSDREQRNAAIVRAAGPAPGHVFNLGHGIVPAASPDNVAALVETVHNVSREIHSTVRPDRSQ